MFRQARAFSIVEVSVATVIFMITSIGVFSTLSNLVARSNTASQTVGAAYYGQQLLEDLHTSVNAALWNDSNTITNPLAPGVHTFVNGIYTVNYTVSAGPSGTRRVDLNIIW